MNRIWTLCALLTAAFFGSELAAQTAQTVNVLSNIPQFGIYTGTAPSGYTPPAGVTMWYSNQVWYSLSKLSSTQQSQIGSDVAVQLTYLAGCDNYDRSGGVFFLIEPAGVAPSVTDPRIDVFHFVTPFSDYQQGARATHVYPNGDVSQFAQMLADPSHDVWVGIAGGSNPYGGDPCTNQNVSPTFAATGFSYSLSLVSTKTLQATAYTISSPISYQYETSLPISASVASPGVANVYATLAIDGHGSESGGDEYEYTTDTLTTNGQTSGSFSSQMNCASYQQYSPDGNPGIFQNNTNGNPRNWCPGAFVPTHTYPITLASGSNILQINVNPSTLNASAGDAYLTGLNVTSTAPAPVIPVNLAPFYTTQGIATDGTSYSSTGGLDGSGYSYSSKLIGAMVTWNGSNFPLGPANAVDTVKNATLVMAPGYFSKLNVIGAAVNGNQTSQKFVVSYADGTSTTISQSISDWCTPQKYSGETSVATMSYRDTSSGTTSTGCQPHLYGYTLTLNNAKLINTIQLPANSNVAILGASLVR